MSANDSTLSADPVLAEIVRRLVEAFQPLRIYVFGSKARGAGDADSDYDLLVIVPDDAPKDRRQSRHGYDRMWGLGAAVDILVWTDTSFRKRAGVVTSLPATVLREGTLVYGS